MTKRADNAVYLYQIISLLNVAVGKTTQKEVPRAVDDANDDEYKEVFNYDISAVNLDNSQLVAAVKKICCTDICNCVTNTCT